MVHISKHDALILLTQAAFIPILSYFLKTSPSPSKQISDMLVSGCFAHCIGGLGLGVVADLAPSAFLSSAAATATLQNMMLPVEELYEDHLRNETFDEWCSIFGDVLNIDVCSQKKWNKHFLNKSKISLDKMNDAPLNKARLMAVKSDLGSAWLRAVPSTACGTRLDNASIRVSLCLRLGLPVVSEYRCLCGADVSFLSYHGLSYPQTPWFDGRCLTWDVTFPHILADKYTSNTSLEHGSAAIRAADFKNSKYVDLNDGTRLFVPGLMMTVCRNNVVSLG
ncbi:hypothetical protein HELRODRAFT_174381 [Helobdella robusta]|uniref:Uncharacterized protein n=1 Tax=Helobdella robusta TaxID=6412 RepID=T1F822_HELRO|nr:hypothetical protein HELRODRAFT_174381 [Helobdella robusta]ESO02916.1 hypothetical protein HELRODRAFT_174381 [Helobdella robusta]